MKFEIGKVIMHRNLGLCTVIALIDRDDIPYYKLQTYYEPHSLLLVPKKGDHSTCREVMSKEECEELFEYMKEQPIMAKFFVLMAEAGRSDATPEHIREMAMRVNVIEQFVPIIEWGQQEGTIKEGSPIVISNAFWCSVQGIAERYATNQYIDLPKAEWIVDIVRRK